MRRATVMRVGVRPLLCGLVLLVACGPGARSQLRTVGRVLPEIASDAEVVADLSENRAGSTERVGGVSIRFHDGHTDYAVSITNRGQFTFTDALVVRTGEGENSQVATLFREASLRQPRLKVRGNVIFAADFGPEDFFREAAQSPGRFFVRLRYRTVSGENAEVSGGIRSAR